MPAREKRRDVDNAEWISAARGFSEAPDSAQALFLPRERRARSLLQSVSLAGQGSRVQIGSLEFKSLVPLRNACWKPASVQHRRPSRRGQLSLSLSLSSEMQRQSRPPSGLPELLARILLTRRARALIKYNLAGHVTLTE